MNRALLSLKTSLFNNGDVFLTLFGILSDERILKKYDESMKGQYGWSKVWGQTDNLITIILQ